MDLSLAEQLATIFKTEYLYLPSAEKISALQGQWYLDSYRTSVVTWLQQISCILELDEQTLSLACNLCDRMLCVQRFDASKILHLAQSCLLLAAKLTETEIPSVFEFVEVCRLGDSQSIVEMESFVLRVLNWKVSSSCTAIHVARLLARLLGMNLKAYALKKVYSEIRRLEASSMHVGIPSSSLGIETFLSVLLNGFSLVCASDVRAIESALKECGVEFCADSVAGLHVNRALRTDNCASQAKRRKIEQKIPDIDNSGCRNDEFDSRSESNCDSPVSIRFGSN
uniref:Cyclin-like domain-containing protein n=1 Tax=Timspurckia oligopyrenoides TaxID=708627 RepID=A0A7S1EQA5_9RHOD|mmetsp:Transcript_11483/g.20768  ORF Transcript_11483/g.20768 Transcript_11483/m.20768 type:complete len:283 (+) Transcript_11483:806-1654(+)